MQCDPDKLQVTEGDPSQTNGNDPFGSFPFDPPEAVRKFMTPENWAAIVKALEAAEAQWDDGFEGFGDDFTEEQMSAWDYQLSQQSSKPTHRRKKWDEAFHLLGQDSRRPPPMRRYFDSVPAETIPAHEAIRPGLRPKHVDARDAPDNRGEGGGWISTHSQSASVDNVILHPHLRHYFDRRGLEASYRQRPHVDHVWLRSLRPRTPGGPTTAEKLQRWKSEPTLPPISPSEKDIHWGQRCLTYGTSAEVREGPEGEKIPWVYDFDRSESEDNVILNPILRHYFDKDGLESSFRNRGRQYGRPLPPVFGHQVSNHNVSQATQLTFNSNSTNASRSTQKNYKRRH